MSADVYSFIESLVMFCKSVLEIPIELYTFGLEVCPWVLDFITEMKRLSNILLAHCDKSKYSHSEVMEIVHDMGYSGTFMDRANELSQKCAGLEPTELESNHLYKSIDEFDSAWAQLQSKRMFD